MVAYNYSFDGFKTFCLTPQTTQLLAGGDGVYKNKNGFKRDDSRAEKYILDERFDPIQDEMDHFDDFQEKDGYESTKPLDISPKSHAAMILEKTMIKMKLILGNYKKTLI